MIERMWRRCVFWPDHRPPIFIAQDWPKIFIALPHGAAVTTVPLEGWRGASTSTVKNVRRLAGRPRAFGDAIAVFADRRARRRCPASLASALRSRHRFGVRPATYSSRALPDPSSTGAASRRWPLLGTL